ncbi:MAG TPA: BrnT family toxin [Vicinamibacteria bacterium]|nr:BrnT family toxin [Vicinamibacteria bacterium]
MVRYNLEWDPEKAKDNLAKHEVAFESAATVFLDPNAVSIFDEDHSREEERWITMGFDLSGALLAVHHTFRNVDDSTCAVRLISARKATKKEARHYERREK